MNSSYYGGINDEKAKRLIIELYDYADKISILLKDVEDLVNGTKHFYISEDGDDYRKKFVDFSANFSTLLNNLRQNARDINTARQVYRKNDIKNVDIFR